MDRGNNNPPIVYTLATGETLTLVQLVHHPRNVHRVCRSTLYKRLRAGYRTWSELTRRPNKSESGRRGGRASRWSRGPHCKSPGARQSWAELNTRDYP